MLHTATAGTFHALYVSYSYNGTCLTSGTCVPNAFTQCSHLGYVGACRSCPPPWFLVLWGTYAPDDDVCVVDRRVYLCQHHKLSHGLHRREQREVCASALSDAVDAHAFAGFVFACLDVSLVSTANNWAPTMSVRLRCRSVRHASTQRATMAQPMNVPVVRTSTSMCPLPPCAHVPALHIQAFVLAAAFARPTVVTIRVRCCPCLFGSPARCVASLAYAGLIADTSTGTCVPRPLGDEGDGTTSLMTFCNISNFATTCVPCDCVASVLSRTIA